MTIVLNPEQGKTELRSIEDVNTIDFYGDSVYVNEEILIPIKKISMILNK